MAKYILEIKDIDGFVDEMMGAEIHPFMFGLKIKSYHLYGWDKAEKKWKEELEKVKIKED